ncbi:MAG: DNA-processing protein DprA [Chloroflexota bacterium]
MSDLKYWLGFNLVKGIGPSKIQSLLDYYGSLPSAWQATEFELQKLGFDKRTIHSFRSTRQALDLDKALARVHQANIQLISWDSPDYPTYLKEIPHAPRLLYIRGTLEELDQWAVAIVGTRKATAYGKQVTKELVTELVKQNITIVSGLARGIDAMAHETAVSLNGRTIGVLGSGVDSIYPAEHRHLAQKIADGHGAIISEYGLGVKPEAKNFPPRNRIISGLSLGVVVVEAGERSGALITTNFALEQGREVFAVPGSIKSPLSRGPNQLIQQGAKLVSKVEDILEELNLSVTVAQTAVQMALPDSTEEMQLYKQLAHEPIHIDDLCRLTGMPANLVSSTLTLMELKGIVQRVDQMNFARLHDAPAS